MGRLFATATGHDAGGKVRLALPAGVTGAAKFTDKGRRRQWLSRDLPPMGKPLTILFIGMNPSTAGKAWDDPTVAKECVYAFSLGYTKYVKCNVMDYIATHPDDLLKLGVKPCSPGNLFVILGQAKGADRIVVCFGKLHKQLWPYGGVVTKALKTAGYELWCFGRNEDGSPKHPLYLKKSTPLERY